MIRKRSLEGKALLSTIESSSSVNSSCQSGNVANPQRGTRARMIARMLVDPGVLERSATSDDDVSAKSMYTFERGENETGSWRVIVPRTGTR